MTKQEINHIYERSVYEIRLDVAIRLLTVPGVTHDQALEEADKFIARLQDEDASQLLSRYR
jgi:hypothetical protein